MTLRLQLLGTPTLLQGEARIPLGRRKAMALLSYLAVARGRHHRESLATLLWPESDASAAFSALRNVLWILRQTPLCDSLQSDRSTVELVDSPDVVIDVNEFRRLSNGCSEDKHGHSSVCADCEPLIRQGIELCHAPFMRGFTVANSVQFDDWQLAEAGALQRELAEALDRLIGYYLGRENWTAAARYARRWLQADELNELGYRRLMQALIAQGKRSEALTVFAACENALDAQLGLAPERATSALAETIRTSQGTIVTGLPAVSSRLPHSLAPLIGRGDVVAELEAELLAERGQVVTVAGLGGCGKTSVALAAGRGIEERFQDGAVLVRLDSQSEAGAVLSATAQALGMPLSRDAAVPAEEQIEGYLRDRNVLLILDGVERVLQQAIRLLPKLVSGPGVRVLVTSRIPLGVQEEFIITLDGLSYPEIGTPAETLGDYPSVRLLRMAAQRQGTLRSDDAPDFEGMARLTRLLEGSPLGLEMAAGWRSVLTWDEIADRVSESLEFLVHMREDVSPKHRTFAAIFEQAWLMLPEAAQVTLRRLSSLRGTFTTQAAEYIAQGHAGDIALLVNRSLIKRVGPDRYVLHEMLRQFAFGKLTSSKDASSEIAVRHTEFYLLAASEWLPALAGPRQLAVLRRMEQEDGNLRTAVIHAASAGATELLRASGECIFFYYDMRTQFQEARTLFEEAARQYSVAKKRDVEVEAFLHICAGWFESYFLMESAAKHVSKGLALLDDRPAMSRLHALAFVICAYASRGKAVEKHLDRVRSSIDYYHDEGLVREEGLAVAAYAGLHARSDEEKAERLAYQSLLLHRDAGDSWGEGLVLMFLARIAEVQGDLDLAFARYQECQQIAEPISPAPLDLIDSIASQARIAGKQGRQDISKELADRAVELSRQAGNRPLFGRSLLEAGRARKMAGDSKAARILLEKSFLMLRHRDWRLLQAEPAYLLAEIALDEQDLGASERWSREVLALNPDREDLDELRGRITQLRERCQETLEERRDASE